MAATHTTNLNLNKPARTDFVSVVSDINDNMDILDGAIGAVPQGETVQGQIDDVNDAIGTVPSGETLQGQIDEKADKDNTVLTSSLSMGRKPSGTVGANSNAIGYNVEASGDYSHAEGYQTIANHNAQHVFGQYNVADTSTNPSANRGNFVEIVGVGTNTSSRSNGRTLDWGGNEHLKGDLYVHSTTGLDGKKVATEENPVFTGSISLGRKANTTIGERSFAVGNNVQATDYNCHAEGSGTIASGYTSHAEGYATTSSGQYSHAEGKQTQATNDGAHAEGNLTQATGKYSHAEGNETFANGNYSHTEGMYTTASGVCSHAEGEGTTASGDYQHVSGKYNATDSTSFEIVGNGTGTNARKNVRLLDVNGNEKLKGDIYVGCNDDSTGGTALGAEVSNLKSALSKQDELVSSWTSGKRIDTSGAEQNTANFGITDYIDITNCFALELFGALYLALATPVAFYNASKVFISAFPSQGTSYVYIEKNKFPQGAVYARCCAYSASDDFSEMGYILHTEKRIADIERKDLALSKSDQKPDIMEGLKYSLNKWYYDDSGRIASNNYWVAGKSAIPVKPETNYSVGLTGQKGDRVVRFCYYKQNANGTRTFLSKESHSNTSCFTTPAECSLATISVDNTNLTNLDDVYMIESDADGRTVPCIEMVNSFDSVYPKTRLKGKKWTTFGDSITASTFRTTGAYHDFIRAETGIVTFNKAVGGSGYKCLDESNKATYQLALTDIAGWSDSDIITCMSGINDCMFMLPPTGNRTELGTYTDVFVEPQDITSYTSNTLMACFNKFISILEENAPFARIGIISPLPTDYTLSGHRYLFKPEDDTNNLSLFVEECKKACKRKGIAYLDLYHTCHLMPWVSAVNNKYYKCYSSDSPDGLHPNVYGHEWIYPAIREFLKTMM